MLGRSKKYLEGSRMDLMIPHIRACDIDREMNVSAYSSFLDLESLMRKKQ